MSNADFVEFKQALEPLGVEFHPHLIRQNQGGLWGMYATAPVRCGEVLARCPMKGLIPVDPARYPAQASRAAKHIHATASLLQHDAHRHFSAYFALFESLDAMRGYSTFFCTQDELGVLAQLSAPLADVIARENFLRKKLLESLCQFDTTIEPDVLCRVMLSYASRAMGEVGFVPGLDCFNHSQALGAHIQTDREAVTLVAKEDFSPGEQVYISYGDLDLLDHAIAYNYYDPADVHFLRFGRRELFPFDGDKTRGIYGRFAGKYQLAVTAYASQSVVLFKDNRLLLSSCGPAPSLMQFFVDFGLRPNEHRAPVQVMKETMSGWLAALDQHNHVDRIPENPLSARLSRFYHVLKKEKELVASARNWLDRPHS